MSDMVGNYDYKESCFFDDAMTDKEPMNAGVITFTFLHTRMCIHSYPHIDIQLVHTYLYQINQQSV